MSTRPVAAEQGSAPQTGLLRNLGRRLGDRFRHGEHWVAGHRHALYGFAVMRIGFGVVLLLYMLQNFGVAQRLWGPGAAWNEPLRSTNLGWPFTVLGDWADDPVLFLIWYVAILAVAIAMIVGWRCRVMIPLMYVLFTALIWQSPFAKDNGDLTVRLMLIYCTFADTGAVWSLDARRRRREGGRLIRRLPAKVRSNVKDLATIAHNFALIVVIVNLCYIYFAAGLFKVQGHLWVEGIAVYYPLAMEVYQPWPVLSELAYSSTVGITLITYLTVIIQVLFPALIISRKTRWIALIGILGMHAGIAVVMGLWTFSAFMALVDVILISTRTWIRIGNAVRRRYRKAGAAIRRRAGHRPPEVPHLPPAGVSGPPEPDQPQNDRESKGEESETVHQPRSSQPLHQGASDS